MREPKVLFVVSAAVHERDKVIDRHRSAFARAIETTIEGTAADPATVAVSLQQLGPDALATLCREAMHYWFFTGGEGAGTFGS